MFSVYGKMQTSGLSEFIPFIGTSAARGQICFQMLYILNSFFTTRGGRCDGWLLLASHLFTPPAIAMVGGGGICWMTVLGAFIHIRRPEIADGCDISCPLIQQEMVHFTLAQQCQCARCHLKMPL